jgi:pyruvate dehydrogenase E2 component (dihydrolipoamide acetyltransferase)
MTAVEIVMPRLSDAMEQGTIVNAPEAAIVSVAAAQPRALVDDAGSVRSRPYATLTLACDHRAVYGADGAAFLARLRALLETPEVLVL